jgi:hypothetical protein
LSYPDGRLDTWLSITGVKLAAAGLSFLGWEIETTGRFIACVGNRGVEIKMAVTAWIYWVCSRIHHCLSR